LADHLISGRYVRVSLPAEDMPALYRSADAFLHLSRDESFGNVFVEAMACGTPVVAYDLPRTRWIVGDGGFLATDRNSEAIASKLKQAMDREDDGSSLVERAQGFQWTSVAGQYRDFLEQVVRAS
jgi:glycosyltransferase involved in cell wall biosynthesis